MASCVARSTLAGSRSTAQTSASGWQAATTAAWTPERQARSAKRSRRPGSSGGSPASNAAAEIHVGLSSRRKAGRSRRSTDAPAVRPAVSRGGAGSLTRGQASAGSDACILADVSDLVGFDAIGSQSAPRLADTAALIEVDGEPHVLDERTGDLHAVSGRTALAAPFLTGDVTLEELADDVAAVFGVPAPAVVEDLVRIAQNLGHLGVLDRRRQGADRLAARRRRHRADERACRAGPLRRPGLPPRRPQRLTGQELPHRACGHRHLPDRPVPPRRAVERAGLRRAPAHRPAQPRTRGSRASQLQRRRRTRPRPGPPEAPAPRCRRHDLGVGVARAHPRRPRPPARRRRAVGYRPLPAAPAWPTCWCRPPVGRPRCSSTGGCGGSSTTRRRRSGGRGGGPSTCPSPRSTTMPARS